MRHNYWSRLLQLLKPACLESVLCNKRRHSNKKPKHRNKRRPHLPQLEKAPCKATRTKRSQNNNNFKGSQGKRNGKLQQQKPLFLLLLAGFHQKLYRPGGSGMTFSKYCKVKTITQEYSIQQSYHSDMKEKYFPRQIINHPKCKWIEFTNQKTKNGWMNKKTQDSTKCCLQETHISSKNK